MLIQLRTEISLIITNPPNSKNIYGAATTTAIKSMGFDLSATQSCYLVGIPEIISWLKVVLVLALDLGPRCTKSWMQQIYYRIIALPLNALTTS